METCFAVTVDGGSHLPPEHGLLRVVTRDSNQLIQISSAAGGHVLAEWSIHALKQLTLIMPLTCERQHSAAVQAKIVVDLCCRPVCVALWSPRDVKTIWNADRFSVRMSENAESPVWQYLQQAILDAVGSGRVSLLCRNWPAISVEHVCADGKRFGHLYKSAEISQGKQRKAHTPLRKFSEQDAPLAADQESPSPTPVKAEPLPPIPTDQSFPTPPRHHPRPGFRPPLNMPRRRLQEQLELSAKDTLLEDSRKTRETGTNCGEQDYTMPVQVPVKLIANPSYRAGTTALATNSLAVGIEEKRTTIPPKARREES